MTGARTWTCPRCGRRFLQHKGVLSHLVQRHTAAPLHLTTVHLPAGILERLDLLVDAGIYPHRSEGIRTLLLNAMDAIDDRMRARARHGLDKPIGDWNDDDRLVWARVVGKRGEEGAGEQ